MFTSEEVPRSGKPAAWPPENACEASTRFARYPVGGGAPTPRILSCFFQKQGNAAKRPRIVAAATKIAATGGRKARCACCPDRGKLSACQKVPERETFFTFFSLLRKEPKVAEGPRPSRLPENGSKLYRIIFFVTFPTFVPKPVYSATRFFECFEPVRKGCCTSDARPLFFESGIPHCKLTGANVFEKGSCSLSLLRWEFVFAVC